MDPKINLTPFQLAPYIVLKSAGPIEKKMLDQITKDVKNILIPRIMKKLPKRVQALFNNKINYHKSKKKLIQ